MEQKVRICLQFSNPNQSADGSPPSAILLPLSACPIPLLPDQTIGAEARRLRPTPAPLFLQRHLRYQYHRRSTVYHRHGRHIEARTNTGDNTNANVNPGIQKRTVIRSPPPPSSPTPRHTRITLFFPTFPSAASLRQTSLPNYLPILAPNAFVKRWNKLVDSSQIPARRLPRVLEDHVNYLWLMCCSSFDTAHVLYIRWIL